jgi:hypothetical protein
MLYHLQMCEDEHKFLVGCGEFSTLSVSHIRWRRTVGLRMNQKLESTWKDVVQA